MRCNRMCEKAQGTNNLYNSATVELHELTQAPTSLQPHKTKVNQLPL